MNINLFYKFTKNKPKKFTWYSIDGSNVAFIPSFTKKIFKKVKKLETNQELIIKTKTEWINKALVDKSQYEKKYKKSLKNNDEFWKKEGKENNLD